MVFLIGSLVLPCSAWGGGKKSKVKRYQVAPEPLSAPVGTFARLSPATGASPHLALSEARVLGGSLRRALEQVQTGMRPPTICPGAPPSAQHFSQGTFLGIDAVDAMDDASSVWIGDNHEPELPLPAPLSPELDAEVARIHGIMQGIESKYAAKGKSHFKHCTATDIVRYVSEMKPPLPTGYQTRARATPPCDIQFFHGPPLRIAIYPYTSGFAAGGSKTMDIAFLYDSGDLLARLHIKRNHSAVIREIGFVTAASQLGISKAYLEEDPRKALEDHKILTQPLFEEGDLTEIIARRRANPTLISLEQENAIALEMVQQLHRLHTEMGSIHLDLKPDNICIDANFRVFLCDLGSAQHKDEPLSSRAQMTPFYSSPERFSDEAAEPVAVEGAPEPDGASVAAAGESRSPTTSTRSSIGREAVPVRHPNAAMDVWALGICLLELHHPEINLATISTHPRNPQLMTKPERGQLLFVSSTVSALRDEDAIHTHFGIQDLCRHPRSRIDRVICGSLQPQAHRLSLADASDILQEPTPEAPAGAPPLPDEAVDITIDQPRIMRRQRTPPRRSTPLSPARAEGAAGAERSVSDDSQ